MSLSTAFLLVAGCGRPAESAGRPAGAGGSREVRTVRLTADDTVQFSQLTIDAEGGEKLRVELTNTGTRPRESMAHNWVLLRPAPEGEITAFGLAAAASPPTYLPAERRSQIVVATRMLGPGESDAVEFTVPQDPGDYPYVCTFPGHFALMKGWLIVK